jgi:hypothetical protein
MNQVALVGNITDDADLRYTQNGTALAGFTVAVSRRSKHTREWQDVNDGFFRCTAWRSVAENASRSLKKGMRVFVARQARPAGVAKRRRVSDLADYELPPELNTVLTTVLGASDPKMPLNPSRMRRMSAAPGQQGGRHAEPPRYRTPENVDG